MTDTPRSFLAAVVQLCSTEDIVANVDAAEAQIRKAASLGARLIAIPETFAFLRISARTPEPIIGLDHSIVIRMCALAEELGIDLVLGSIPEPSTVADKVHNTSVYIGPDGAIRGTYRKLHLFDIDIPGRVTLKESDHMTPGAEPVVVQGTYAPVGLSICYDLRFPELYRELTMRGAKVLTCPAAFTLHTGKDHWLPLLRARAIENQSWVIAPGQAGFHGGKRHSYGKSVIIDPWGLPVALASDGVGIAIAEIDLDLQDRVREGLPCAQHRHEYFWDAPSSGDSEG
ncbi:MAG: putative amidohydrolase [Myxococcota bacterium]|jgi:predicted amidohydrolase